MIIDDLIDELKEIRKKSPIGGQTIVVVGICEDEENIDTMILTEDHNKAPLLIITVGGK